MEDADGLMEEGSAGDEEQRKHEEVALDDIDRSFGSACAYKSRQSDDWVPMALLTRRRRPASRGLQGLLDNYLLELSWAWHPMNLR
ncbi:hypothetical protein L3X38_010725 [Prunus dulcis]|uniref:Uncharacterized protein n=1 Tax=Prunus dulcis TaxID=3755 RepID=A0AAD4ZEG3_PRUDU|nr:hypothetical protein L3X38_010725 [Prunus dulcis]